MRLLLLALLLVAGVYSSNNFNPNNVAPKFNANANAMNQFNQPNNVGVAGQFQGANEQNVQAVQNMNQGGFNPNLSKGVGKVQKKGPGSLISESPECRADVSRICPEAMRESNFNTLTCLSQRKDDTDLSAECHTYVWEYKRQMSTDNRFVPMLSESCKSEKERIIQDRSCGTAEETEKNLVSCLMLHKKEMRPSEDNRCYHMVNRIAIIVFQDYRLIGSFYENCKDDVHSLQCGSIDVDQNPTHTQGYTIECLRENVDKVSTKCKREILVVAELQAEDFNLDRGLYFACKADRNLLCGNLAAGEGRVFECLMNNQNNPEMSPECKTVLMARAKLMVEDPEVSFPLREYCSEDLKRFAGECNYEEMIQEHSRMASMLLCLEFKQRSGKPLTSKCVNAMKGARKMLMQDYEMNPAIVKNCGDVIQNYCGGLEKGGKTLHCLMRLGKQPNEQGIDLEEENPKCFKSIEFLVRSVNPVEDISTDAVLLESCKPVLDSSCKKNNGQYVKDPIQCLFDEIEEDSMTDECAEVLLEISYFTARDWALDRKLFKSCAADAREKCNVDKWTGKGASHGEIFACLYRHINHDKEALRLSDKCTAEVIRVMKNRAVSVGLNPYVEFQCRQDLAALCSKPEITSNKKELECLQDIYSVQSVKGTEDNERVLTAQCRAALKNYTKVETEEIEINRKLYKSCKPMIEKYCNEEKRGTTNQGHLFNCMVENKNKPDVQDICAAGIEHMQLIQLKDFEFDKSFRDKCRMDVKSFCQEARSKDEVVTCLSKILRDDRVQGRPSRLSEGCEVELKRPLGERYEDIKMDRETFYACKGDVQDYCSKVKSGQGRLLECLKDHKEDLSIACKRKIFEREEEEFEEPDKIQEKDFLLNKACKTMINEYCDDEENVLKCLWKHRLQKDFDDRCLKVVRKRMVAKGEDVRLNADMFKACQTDIKEHCRDVLEKAKTQSQDENKVEAYQGVVINCLRENYAKQKLTDKCSVEVRQFIRASAQEWKMDFQFRIACRDIVKSYCSEATPNKVEECLKDLFLEGKITEQDDKDSKCRNEIKRVLDEGAMDIQADPILQKTCSLDLEHVCPHVAPGKGRQISCLLDKLKQEDRSLTADCQKMLTERKAMWDKAGDRVHRIDTVGDLVTQLNNSSSRHYFLTIFGMIITFIFLGGLLFGRITKRVAREMKSR